MTRQALNRVVLGEPTLTAEAETGEIEAEPGLGPLERIVSCLDEFEFWFNIVEP